LSCLHRWNPLTKVALSGFLLLLGLLVPWRGAYAVFALITLPLALSAGVGLPLLRALVKLIAPFAIPIVLIQGLFWTGGTPLLSLGPLSVKAEGLLFAAGSLGRILAMASAFLLLSFTTRIDVLMRDLQRRGVPNQVLYLVVTSIQIVPRFQARAATILEAQRARGLETEGGLRRRLGAIMPLVGPLLLSSLMDVEERAIALEARAFNRIGPRTSLVTPPDTRAELLLRWALLLSGLAVIAARIWAWSVR
jgi:energy-coupling factor transport system permease protein